VKKRSLAIFTAIVLLATVVISCWVNSLFPSKVTKATYAKLVHERWKGKEHSRAEVVKHFGEPDKISKIKAGLPELVTPEMEAERERAIKEKRRPKFTEFVECEKLQWDSTELSIWLVIDKDNKVRAMYEESPTLEPFHIRAWKKVVEVFQ
jgi:hypothetical protein